MQKMKHVHKKSAFLLKTYEILENKKYQDIVNWHHDGIGFIITDIDKFTSTILPLYFKHSNFASYIRQLNMYGFSKKRSTRSENYYHHAKFQRNQKELIRQIQRKTQKKQTKGQIKSRQNNEEVKISSQLSIQLQSQYLSTRKIDHPDTIEKSVESKFHELSSTNQSLINIQFTTLLQLFNDLSTLRNVNVSEQEKEDIKDTLTEYIQTQCLFFNQLKQKCKVESKHLKSLAILGTEQSLRQKREQVKQSKLEQFGCSNTQQQKDSQEMLQ